MHLCADSEAGATAARAAAAVGMTYLRFDDAFSLALCLLRTSDVPTVLLLAIDAMAAAELELPAWAARKWSGLAVLAHGCVDRLNGRAAGRLRHVALSDLAKTLAGLGPAAPAPPKPVASPSPESSPAPTVPAGPIPQAAASPKPEATPVPASDPQPFPEPEATTPIVRPVPLRLHAPEAPAGPGPLLTREELAALLAEEADNEFG